MALHFLAFLPFLAQSGLTSDESMHKPCLPAPVHVQPSRLRQSADLVMSTQEAGGTYTSHCFSDGLNLQPLMALHVLRLPTHATVGDGVGAATALHSPSTHSQPSIRSHPRFLVALHTVTCPIGAGV